MSKSARIAMLLQFLHGDPKPAFSEKVQREMFPKIAQKVALV